MARKRNTRGGSKSAPVSDFIHTNLKQSCRLTVRSKSFVAVVLASVLALSPAPSFAEPINLAPATDSPKQPGESKQSKPTEVWSVSGRVVDHRGVAVRGAVVVLLGEERIRVDAKRPENWSVSRTQTGQPSRPPSTRTGERGEFSITREGQPANRIAVISNAPLLWVVSRDRLQKDVVIRLPQSGSLAIRCDLPGKPDSLPVNVDLRTFDGINWKTDVLAFHMGTSHLKNPGVTVFENLPPARYAVERFEETKTGERQILLTPTGRTLASIEAGKSTTIDFNRKTGRPIKGRVGGLEDVNLQHAHVTISYLGPDEDPITEGRYKGKCTRRLTQFDTIPITSDGQFKTPPIPPGDYFLRLFVTKSTTPKQARQSSDFQGKLDFSVPATGKLPTLEVTARPIAKQAVSIQSR